MKSFGIFLISVALVAYGESRSASETPANRAVSLNDLFTKAQADITKLGKELHANLNLPDQGAIVSTLQSHSTDFVNNLKSYANQMSEAVKAKSPEAEKLWANLKTTMNKVADDLAAQIPVAKDQVSQLEAKFLSGVDTVVKQSNLATQTINRNSDVIQEDVAKIVRKAVEMAVESTARLSSQIQQQATANPKP